jgi:hypothetical protein
LYRPLLKTKVKTSNGFRTIALLGKGTQTIFSEEVKEYFKYG